VGLGAILGTAVLPVLRSRFGPGRVVAVATVVYAGTVAVVGWAPAPVAVGAALVLTGLSWIAVQSTLGAEAQLLLPAWARARALAHFQLVFMGGQALGALLWGAVADVAGLTVAFLVPAAGLVLAALVGLLLTPMGSGHDPREREPAWPRPPSLGGRAPRSGPVLVTLEWRVGGEDVGGFLALMRQLGLARRRTGAALWGVFQDADDPQLFLETFTVPTWQEHLRQHLERGTVTDVALEQRARAHLVPGAAVRVRHLVWAWAVSGTAPDTEPELVPAVEREPTPTAAPAAVDPV
jgi:MFS family permease